MRIWTIGVSLLAALAIVACGDDSRAPTGGLAVEDVQHDHPAGDLPPNVVLIVLDTARADRVWSPDHARATAAHLERFARDAVVYRGAHSVAPWTLPSHMSMFTGLLPGQHGATWQAFAEPADMELGDILGKSFSLADPSILLAPRLRRLGYATAGFSSNAWISRRCGFGEGFDHFHEMWKERKGLERRYDGLPRAFRTLRPIDLGDAGLMLLRFREHAELERELREPFFLFFNFIDPHYPYSPPRPWRYTYSNDSELADSIARFEFDEMEMVAGDHPVDVTRFAPFYDAEIDYVDFAVGRLLTWLRERGYYDESLIVITSDHGEHLGEEGRFSHQLSVEEELLRIPLAIKYPGNAGAGSVVQDPLVGILDLYATILAAAGDGGEGPATPSRDLAGATSVDRSHLIAEYYYSTPYLEQHRKRYEPFPVEEHQVVRRVVYDRTGRHLFHEREGVLSLMGDATPEGEAAGDALRDYLATLEGGLLQESGEELDPETLERLRSLGYVE